MASTSDHSSAERISLEEILPSTEGSESSLNASPSQNFLIPVALTVHRPQGDNLPASLHQTSEDDVDADISQADIGVPVVSTTSEMLVSGGDMISGTKVSEAEQAAGNVTLTLHNPDGHGESKVVGAQIAKMIPINLPKDGKAITKLVQVHGAVQAGGHTMYQIVVEPITSTAQGVETDSGKLMLGQVVHVTQDQEASSPKAQPACISVMNTGVEMGSSSKPIPTSIPEPVEPSKPLPPNCPPWAARLRDVEEIGDSYRGYVESEVELDLLLTFHKQQTGSYWGTRQTPSHERPSKRLMWKSQYVPYDGIPFINAGSRAVVMECQYGPRRKGAAAKKLDMGKKGFQVTCPARIYIKKVKKFPQYRVGSSLHKNSDRKLLRQAQDNAFQTIKEIGVDNLKPLERYYVQLPTTKAHQYHDNLPATQIPSTHYSKPPENIFQSKSEPAVVVRDVESADQTVFLQETPPSPAKSTHIDPQVAEKIRELVSHGIVNAYIIRQNLRNFVMHKLFTPGSVPERHNLHYFPTINNIQNHVYEALRAIEQGELVPVIPVTLADLASMSSPPHRKSQESPAESEQPQEHVMVLPAVSTSAGGNLQAQTVTVTLTQNPDDSDGGAIISRVETQMMDGSTRVCDSISPETAQLLSQLTPKMFTHQNITQVQETPEGTVTIQMQRLTETQAATSEINHSESMLQTDETPISQPEGLLHPDDPSTSTLNQPGDLLEAGTDHLGQSDSLLETDGSDAHVSATDVLLQATESSDELHQSDALLEQEHSAIDQSEVMTHKDDGVISELTSQAEDQASLLLSMHESISLSHSAPEMQDDTHDPQTHGGDCGESLGKRQRLDVDDISDNNHDIPVHESISLAHSAQELQDVTHNPETHGGDCEESLSKRPRLDVDDTDLHANISLSHSAPELQDKTHDPLTHDGDCEESLAKRQRLDVGDISDNTDLDKNISLSHSASEMQGETHVPQTHFMVTVKSIENIKTRYLVGDISDNTDLSR